MSDPAAPVPSPAPAGPTLLDQSLFVVFAAFIVLLLGKTFVFGSEAGNFWYGYYSEAKGPAVAVALGAGLATAMLLHFTLPLAERRPWLAVAIWMVAAFGFHLATRGLYCMSLKTLVLSDGSNSFYSISLRHRPGDLLRNYEDLRPGLALHGATNMPGKVFFYYLLELITKEPLALGCLIIVATNLASAMVFAVIAEWLGDRQAALVGMVLSIVVPAKVGYIPLLNTVTPFFILLPLLLWLVYLRKPRSWLLLLLGASLFLLVFFDALPLVTGLVFVGALVQRLVTREYNWKELWKVAVFVPMGFAAPHLALRGIFGFDLFKNFFTLLRVDTVEFNKTFRRTYEAWVVHDLKEFFMDAGLLPSLLFLLWVWERLVGAVRSIRARSAWLDLKPVLTNPATNLLAFFALDLVVVDLLGVTRGEITRLWIFFDFFQCLACGWLLIREHGLFTTRFVVGSVAIQAVITTAMVPFMGQTP